MQTKYGRYQEQSRKTYSLIPPEGTEELVATVYPTLGLVNEAGEFAGKVKKLFRDKNGAISADDKEALKSELGDVLWYLTQICTNLGFTLEEVAEANLDKLFDRLERGAIQGEGDKR